MYYADNQPLPYTYLLPPLPVYVQTVVEALVALLKHFWRGGRAPPFSNLTDRLLDVNPLSGFAVTVYEVLSRNKILPKMRGLPVLCGGWRENFHPDRSELPVESETRCVGCDVWMAIQRDFLSSSDFPSQLGFRTLFSALFTHCPSCCCPARFYPIMKTSLIGSPPSSMSAGAIHPFS